MDHLKATALFLVINRFGFLHETTKSSYKVASNVAPSLR